MQAGAHRAVEDQGGLEQLYRYITRPAIANERLSVNRAGQVVLKLKTAWCCRRRQIDPCTKILFGVGDNTQWPKFAR